VLLESLDNANSELLEHISKTQEMKRNTLAEAQKFSEMYEKSRNEIEKVRQFDFFVFFRTTKHETQ